MGHGLKKSRLTPRGRFASIDVPPNTCLHLEALPGKKIACLMCTQDEGLSSPPKRGIILLWRIQMKQLRLIVNEYNCLFLRSWRDMAPRHGAAPCADTHVCLKLEDDYLGGVHGSRYRALFSVDFSSSSSAARSASCACAHPPTQIYAAYVLSCQTHVHFEAQELLVQRRLPTHSSQPPPITTLAHLFGCFAKGRQVGNLVPLLS